jgi:O-antigen ligase
MGKLSLKKLSNKLNILKFLFYIFPAAMLTSSGYITAYTSILTIYSLYYFFHLKIKINLSVIDYLIIFFFIISIASTLINMQTLGSFMVFKSILDLRFAILFFTMRSLINNKIINIKPLCNISLICTVFVTLDIFLQVIYGKNILGYPEIDGRYGGVFGEEAIAGSYIQKFSLISILAFFLIKLENKGNFFFTIFTITLLGLGILMSLDRMPFIVYLFNITLLSILLKELRLRFLLSLILIFTIFLFFFNNYSKIENKYFSLLNETGISKIQKLFSIDNKIIENTSEDKINNELSSGYLRIYNTAFSIFLNNPFIGSGVKSFWSECNKLQVNNKKYLSCTTHPHNIYLEILVNQGILGILIFFSFILILLKKNYLNILLKKTSIKEKIITVFLFVIFIGELLPFRSFGSIFQTVNGTIFWFFMALTSSRFFIKKF